MTFELHAGLKFCDDVPSFTYVTCNLAFDTLIGDYLDLPALPLDFPEIEQDLIKMTHRSHSMSRHTHDITPAPTFAGPFTCPGHFDRLSDLQAPLAQVELQSSLQPSCFL